MIGFELIIADKSVTAALKAGVLSLIVSGRPDHLDLSFSGLNTQTDEFITWHETKLCENDVLYVDVLNVDEPSAAVRTKSSDESLLEEYCYLKEILETKRLI